MAKKYMMRMLFAAAAVFGLVLAQPARAADTPATLTGATVVDAGQVRTLMAAGATVIDARVASEYAEGHIKGAESVVYHEKSAKSPDFNATQDEFNVKKLPANKAANVVFYCNGPECWKSYKASSAAIKAGYTGVHWYRAGFPDWKAKGLPVE